MNHTSKKPIDDLARKLDEVETKYITYNTLSRNDGVNYWRGKKIISLSDWCEIANVGEVFTTGNVNLQNTREALEFFPDDYGSGWLIFPKGVEAKYTEESFIWYVQFVELLKFRRHPKFKDIDMNEFIKDLKYKKEHPNWREDEYREQNPDAVDGPWNAYGFT